MVDLNPARCVMQAGGDFEREDELDARVLRSLQPFGRYLKVRSVGMVGIYLTVFVRDNIAAHVHAEDADRIRTSSEGIAGKKGAVAIRFCVGSKSVSFMNVHLPSGQARTSERSAALRQVMAEAFQGVNMLGGARPPKLGFRRASNFRTAGHDCAFVFGDLNFRPNISLEELPKGIARMTLEEVGALRALDASICERPADPALEGFTEGEVGFPPTYKYKVGTNSLDENRVPAWTDRVFYLGESVELAQYQAHMALRHTSDHRPVSALFRVTCGTAGAGTTAAGTTDT